MALLIKGGAQCDIEDTDGFTALTWAIILKEKWIADLLRRAGAKEALHLEGSPLRALITASESGDLIKLRAAITAGAELDALYEGYHEKYTALMRAADLGYLNILDELLKAGANPDQAGIDRGLNAGVTPLILAARAGHTQIVKRLLEAGAHVDVQQVNLFTTAFGCKHERGRPLDAAIHEAASAGHTEIVELLTKAGADTKIRSGNSGSAIEAAALSGKKRTVEVLAGAKPIKGRSKTVGAKALIAAVNSRDFENVRAFIESGTNVNACTRRGENALTAAAADGNAAMVKLLVDAGAKPAKARTEAPATELMMAVAGGHKDIVQLILNAGAEVDVQSFDGQTALHWAVMDGEVEIAKLLLNAGASKSLRDAEGKTPLEMVKQVIAGWSQHKKHPLAGEMDLEPYRRCLKLLEGG